MELCDLPAHELAARIRNREVSAVEALDSALARVRAVITLTEERARARAISIDEKIGKGGDNGPLVGVPFTAKDIFTVKGVLATAASRILSNFVGPYTATPIQR